MHGKERIEETQKRRKKSSKDRNIFYNELKVYINEQKYRNKNNYTRVINVNKLRLKIP